MGGEESKKGGPEKYNAKCKVQNAKLKVISCFARIKRIVYKKLMNAKPIIPVCVANREGDHAEWRGGG